LNWRAGEGKDKTRSAEDTGVQADVVMNAPLPLARRSAAAAPVPVVRAPQLALKSGDPAAQSLARDVVNRMASRGYHGFRDLLG
jgi:hypothetical protein